MPAGASTTIRNKHLLRQDGHRFIQIRLNPDFRDLVWFFLFYGLRCLKERGPVLLSLFWDAVCDTYIMGSEILLVLQ